MIGNVLPTEKFTIFFDNLRGTIPVKGMRLHGAPHKLLWVNGFGFIMENAQKSNGFLAV